MKVRILKNGVPVTAENKVAFTNLTLQSLIRQLDLSLEQKVINSSVGLHYNYKSYLDAILNYMEESKDTSLQSQLFFKDEADEITNTDPEGG